MKHEQFTIGTTIRQSCYRQRGPKSVVTAITNYYIVAVHPDHGTFRIYPHGYPAWEVAQ